MPNVRAAATYFYFSYWTLSGSFRPRVH